MRDRVLVHARVAGPTGTRPPIVLVHGIAVSSRYMIPTIRALAPRFRVLAPDLPGAGRSTKPSRALDVPELADVLAAWLDAGSLPPCVLVGNSFGCEVVVDCAVRYPQRVQAVVLAGPTVDPSARTAPEQIARWITNAAREPLSLVAVVARDALDWGPRRILATFGHSLRDPIEAKLPLLGQPALVVRGERDAIAPQRWAERATALLPHGRLVVIRGAPHAVNWNAAGPFSREIERFVAELEGPPGSA